MGELCVVVAVAIDAAGRKRVLDFQQCSSEKSTGVRDLVAWLARCIRPLGGFAGIHEGPRGITGKPDGGCLVWVCAGGGGVSGGARREEQNSRTPFAESQQRWPRWMEISSRFCGALKQKCHGMRPALTVMC